MSIVRDDYRRRSTAIDEEPVWSTIQTIDMTPAQFKKLALSMPGAEEHSHMGHPDFRLAGKGKIFATLQPDKDLAMVKISVEQQAVLVDEHPDLFVLFGGWSKDGATGIRLKKAPPALVAELVREAFEHVAASKPSARVKRMKTKSKVKSGIGGAGLGVAG